MLVLCGYITAWPSSSTGSTSLPFLDVTRVVLQLARRLAFTKTRQMVMFESMDQVLASDIKVGWLVLCDR